MADGVSVTAGSGTKMVTDEGTYSGETMHLQGVGLFSSAGAEGSRVFSQIAQSNPLPARIEVPWGFHSAITRPANTTTYAVGDMLGDTGGWSVLSVTGAALVAGGLGRLDDIVVNVSSYQTAPLPLLDILLFTTAATPTSSADNVAAAFTDAENEFCEGVITVQTWSPVNVTAGSGGNQVGRADPGQLPLIYKCNAASTTLYVAARFASAYVPLSGEKFEIKGRGVYLL